MIHLRQSLKITAYECARVGIVPDAEVANVQHQGQSMLADFGVASGSVAMQPSDPKTLTQGDYFEVTVTADFAPNSLVGGWFCSDKQLTESVALRAE